MFRPHIKPYKQRQRLQWLQWKARHILLASLSMLLFACEQNTHDNSNTSDNDQTLKQQNSSTNTKQTLAKHREFVIIGTGGIADVYYPAGGELCRLVNQKKQQHGVRCAVESTGGSVYNINNLRTGEIDIGIAQSDWQYHAYHGSSVFSEQTPFTELRTVMSVHTESFTIIARADSGIKHFDDLKGKRVNIGNPDSGTRATMELLLASKGWSTADFSVASELKSSEQTKALCDRTIDAVTFVVGHPNDSIKAAAAACEIVIIGVTGDVVDKLVASHSYYQKNQIDGGLYEGNDQDIATFGVDSTVLASAAASDSVIYEIVKASLNNIEEFRLSHPAFAQLDVTHMTQGSLITPLHPGAKKAFVEAGIALP